MKNEVKKSIKKGKTAIESIKQANQDAENLKKRQNILNQRINESLKRNE